MADPPVGPDFPFSDDALAWGDCRDTSLLRLWEQLQRTGKELRQQAHPHAALEQELRRLPEYDPLTGLLNRYGAINRLAQICREVEQADHHLVASLNIDLDDFGLINDSLGPAAGDALLCETARCLKQLLATLEPSFTHKEVVRFGGDEFVILLGGPANVKDVEAAAMKVLTYFDQCSTQEGKAAVRCSVGVRISRGEALADPQVILRDADTALHQAKEEGKFQYVMFVPSMHQSVLQRAAFERDLQKGAESGQFSVVYQPIYRLAERRLVGFEVLVRWRHPQHGWISPARFIPVAERSNQIVHIDRWVLERAVEQIRDWLADFACMQHLSISVNISRRHVNHPELPQFIRQTLSRCQVPPQRLNLEITETTAMHHLAQSRQVLEGLRELGVGLHLDDFGTGVSSLGCLDQLPMNVVKLDRNFVAGLDQGRQQIASVQAMIDLVHHRDMAVVAEGVETLEQVSCLQTLDCDFAQGYFFAPPLNICDAQRLVETECLLSRGMNAA